MRIELSKLHSELQTTMIYVTHDQVEAMTLADKIVVLNEGKIEQIGVPLDLYQRPANLFVAGFIGAPRMNFLKVRAEHTSEEGCRDRGSGFPIPAFEPRENQTGRGGSRCGVDPGLYDLNTSRSANQGTERVLS